MNKRWIIVGVLRVAKALGLFRIARRLTRSDLRILCYHGFVLEDEDAFRESLFVSRGLFEQRMRYLRERGFGVLPLGEALERLAQGTLPPDSVAITIDDGFHGVHAVAREILQRHGFPATLYLTSYYFEKATPIFQLAIDYICWKSPMRAANLSGLGIPALAGAQALELTPANRQWISSQVFAYGAIDLDEEGRVELSRKLAACLGVDYARISESRMLSLISPEEALDLEKAGIGIEMHTHRHQFPDSPAGAHAELRDNRAAVEPVIGRRMEHFCYPSGKWSRLHHPVLDRDGVKSATTCIAGLARRNSHPLALPRILDDNRVSRIEFEAEVNGFSELLRRARGKAQAPLAGYPCLAEWVSTHGGLLSAI